MRTCKRVIVMIAIFLCLTGCKEDASPVDNNIATEFSESSYPTATLDSQENPEITTGSDADESVDVTENSLYSVIFYSNDGTVLKVDTVELHASATPPVDPQMEYGTIFTAWDRDFSDIKENLAVHPLYEEVRGRTNVFAATSVYGKVGETIVVPIQLCGEVCVSGFDITVNYDAQKLELISVTEDDSVIYNDENLGQLRINYVSAENTVADVDVCYLQFIIKEAFRSDVVSIKINSVCAFSDSMESKNDSMYTPDVNVIDGNVYVIP